MADIPTAAPAIGLDTQQPEVVGEAPPPMPVDPSLPAGRGSLEVLRESLGTSFSASQERVALKPGSRKAAELPRPDHYEAYATITTETENTAKISCSGDGRPEPASTSGQRSGMPECTVGRTLPDGRHVEVRTWIFRDRGTGLLHGVSEVWFPVLDYQRFIHVALHVTGRGVSEANLANEAAQIREWLNSLHDELVAAATDPRSTPTAKELNDHE